MPFLPFWLAASLSIALNAKATSLYRCEDATGYITFTQIGCSTEQSRQSIKVGNPAPNSNHAISPIKPQRSEMRPSKLNKKKEEASLVVVGKRKDACSNWLSHTERRKAVVQRKIKAGMTQADVESALGKPDRISQNNAEMRYQYRADKWRGTRSISFDQEGCVKGKEDRATQGKN